jgi:hypothetical protein
MSQILAKPGNRRVKQHPNAGYIAEMTRELARLARREGCETLSYMLEIASLEAEVMAGPPEGTLVS